MGRIFRALVHLYPQAHRDLLGAEMQAVFERGARENRDLGPVAYVCFLLTELVGFVSGAVRARLSAPPINAEPVASGLPEEVLEAQNRVAVTLNRLLFAISHHQFVQARKYSDEERNARQELRRVMEKYGLA
jgi:hypothetical protein